MASCELLKTNSLSTMKFDSPTEEDEEDNFIKISHNHWPPIESEQNIMEKSSKARKNAVINLKNYVLKSTIGKVFT